MMRSRIIKSVIIPVLLLMPTLLLGQSFNTAVIGTVTDPSGAVIPGAELTLKSKDTDTAARFTTGAEGLYHFGNLARGTYDLTVSAKGFRDFVERGIVLNINETVTVNVKLEVGASEQRIEVTAEGSPLNQVDATIKQSISPTSIEQLPLAVSGKGRRAMAPSTRAWVLLLSMACATYCRPFTEPKGRCQNAGRPTTDVLKRFITVTWANG